MLKRIIIFLTVTFLLGAGTVIFLRSRPAAPVRIDHFSAQTGPSVALRSVATSRININTASLDDLMELEGVGKVLAGRIVAYRASNGLFILKDDIMRVKGIGPALYEKIKDRISVE